MKTTCTLAKLRSLDNSVSRLSTISRVQTYAAVQANISILLAFVTIPRDIEKTNVQAQRIPKRAARFVTQYKMMMEISGVIEANVVPRISMIHIT